MMNQRLVPNAIEPRGVVAHFEPGKGSMTIWSSTQNPHILRTMIAAMTGLGQDQVRAIAPEVGGGFGAKINIYGEEYVTAAISKRLGIPVKWIEDRSEAFVATTHGRDIIGYIDIAATRDGKVLGLKMRLIADIGAYNMLLTAAIPTLTMLMANGTYAIPAIRTTLTEVFTNKTPTDAYRGAGRPEATYFVERAMDMLARELKMDPGELRRRNFIPPDQFPYATQMGAVYDSGDYDKALDLALKASNWNALVAERDAARKDGRLVGLGLAMYVEVCGLGPSSSLPTGGWEHSQVTIERDGRISATTGASPHGQGNETTFAQMLADQFGVPIEHITIHHGDTGVVKQGIGTFGSRSQAVGGTALHLAGGKVKAKMAKFAAALLEAHEDDIVFENGRIGVKGSPASAKSFAEVAGYAYVPVPLPPGLEPGLSDEAFFEPANNTYPFGCVISMLEIDRETGEPTLLKLVAVDDAGNLINPLIVEGQIHGGLAQGIGQAMIEEAVYNDDGQLLTGSFMDYALPRATDFPRFELHATVTPTPVNPLGAKGVGEAGTLGSTPCIVNAAVDALVGVRRDAHRHDAAAREAVAHHPRRPGVIPTTFEYARATSLDDALAKLKAAGEGGKFIAGGHSLVPLMKLRLSEPQVLIDISRIPDLAGIDERDGKIIIGAATVHHDVATSALLLAKCPAVAEAAASIGDPQVRNRGTIGGSVAHADPSADMPAVLLALDAEIHLKGPRGWRMVKASDFFQDLFTVDMRADEIIASVQFAPVRDRGVRQAASARVALRHRRRRGGARGEWRHDRVGARRR